MHERDRHTHTQTPHDGIGRAYAQQHAAKIVDMFLRTKLLTNIKWLTFLRHSVVVVSSETHDIIRDIAAVAS